MKENRKELREHIRLKAYCLIRYATLNAPETMMRVANTKDISSHGLKFWTDEVLEIGTLLNLTILIPGREQPVKAMARVQHTRKAFQGLRHYVGVMFLEIAKTDQAFLKRFIRRFERTREHDFLEGARTAVSQELTDRSSVKRDRRSST